VKIVVEVNKVLEAEAIIQKVVEQILALLKSRILLSFLDGVSH
jgi:hypothetical protein|tara:strand:+ start:209 stop:337 length:129 start_codon:yes stop_codon:yes gene_type:complete